MSKDLSKTENGSTINPLAVLLSDPDRLASLDTDKFHALLDAQERIVKQEARQAFARAMHAAQGDMTPVRKRGRNSFTGSMYALLEDVERMMDPIIDKHGFSISTSHGAPEVDNHIKIVMTVRHVGGHEEQHYKHVPADVSGMKGGKAKTLLHGEQSSMTYARRTMKCEIFNVTTTADDDGNAGAKVGPSAARISEEQAANIDCLMDDAGADRKRFMDYLKQTYGVDKIEDLPASCHRAVITKLEQKRRQGGDDNA